jgi:hypothetical protein
MTLSSRICTAASHPVSPTPFLPTLPTLTSADLVLWNANKKGVYLIELTICFETRYEEAHSLKEGKYIELVEEISTAGVYSPQLITLEVGSRGPFYPAGFKRLKSYISGPDKHWKTLLREVTRTALMESHRIWTMRNWRDPVTD